MSTSEKFGVVEQRTWEVVTKAPDGEATVHELHYERKLPEVSPEDYHGMFVRQAPPVRIIPSRRNIPSIDTETTVFLSDAHFPFQNQRALDLARVALKALNPTTITFLGDELDATNFSKYPTRQEWQGGLQKSIDGFHEYVSQLKADNPQAKLVQHESNHHIRLEKMIREYNGDLLGLRRANAQNELGVLTVGFLLRHDELGVEYVSGYPNAEYWHTDSIKSFHGHESVANGSTMSRVINRETVSCVSGHSHKGELIYRTFRDGREDKTIFGMNTGSLADFSQLPKDTYSTDQNNTVVPSRVNWQSFVGVIYHNEEMASPHLLPIDKSGIHVFDKHYKN